MIKVIQKETKQLSEKSITFVDSKNVKRLVTFNLLCSGKGYDIIASLFLVTDESISIIEQTSFQESTGRSLPFADAVRSMRNDILNIESNFSFGYIWRGYQRIE